MVDEFYQTNLLPPGINNSFVTLIPKIKGDNRLKDFRPISLVGSLYKIILKLLATRVKQVMSEVINDHQNAFIKGRKILDNILIANEAINFIRKRKGKRYLFKLDFHKDFDFFLWEYINEVMASMGFGNRWRGWIMQCISIAKMSVLVNGSSTEEFNLERGLRQGDPLVFFSTLQFRGWVVCCSEVVTWGWLRVSTSARVVLLYHIFSLRTTHLSSAHPSYSVCRILCASSCASN